MAVCTMGSCSISDLLNFLRESKCMVKEPYFRSKTLVLHWVFFYLKSRLLQVVGFSIFDGTISISRHHEKVSRKSYKPSFKETLFIWLTEQPQHIIRFVSKMGMFFWGKIRFMVLKTNISDCFTHIKKSSRLEKSKTMCSSM